ncbi:hypothetical protein D3C81_1788540 [compost metagenome]
MFNCVPNGITNPAVCGRTPKFSCAHFILSGIVAELELVANAVISAVRVPFKKVHGLIRPKIQSRSGNTTAPWKIVVPVTTTANSAKRLNTEISSVAINFANKAKIPNGANFITQPTSNIIISKNC